MTFADHKGKLPDEFALGLFCQSLGINLMGVRVWARVRELNEWTQVRWKVRHHACHRRKGAEKSLQEEWPLSRRWSLENVSLPSFKRPMQ